MRIIKKYLPYVILPLLAIVNYGIYLKHQIELQDYNNNYLSQEITLTDEKLLDVKDIKKHRTSIINRIQVISDLRSNTPPIHYLLEAISHSDENLFLESLEFSKGQLTLHGTSNTPFALPNLNRLLNINGFATYDNKNQYEIDEHGKFILIGYYRND